MAHARTFVIGRNTSTREFFLASGPHLTHFKGLKSAESMRTRFPADEYATYSNTWTTRAQAQRYCDARNTGDDMVTAMRYSHSGGANHG